jgi:hypothetical protein
MGSTMTANTNTIKISTGMKTLSVVSDGKLRYDTISDAYGVYGNQSATEREHDETYQNSKGKAGKGSKGAKGYKGSKGAKGYKGSGWDRGKRGKGTYQSRSPKKAKATGTTATEATIAEEEPMEAVEEVPMNNEKETNNMSADPLTYQRRRCSAKSANGQRKNSLELPMLKEAGAA